jgi:hypothetical protein
MKSILRFGLGPATLASVLVLGACGDSNAPEDVGINDPQALVTSMRGLVASFTAGALVGVGKVTEFGGNALGLLSRGHGSGLAAAVGARPSPVIRRHGMFRVPALQGGTQSIRPQSGDDRLLTQGDAIDDGYYGTVFLFNPQTQAYEDDGSASGPADGVRFLLYDVVANVIDPNTQVGTLDIRDQSTPSSTAVRVVVTGLGASPVTYADYGVTLPASYNPSAQSFDLVSDGTLFDGAASLGFTLHFAQAGPRDQIVTLTLDGPEADLQFDFADSFDPASEDTHTAIDAVLVGASETVRLSGFQDLDASSARFTTDLTLKANDRLLATATSDDGFGLPNWEKTSGAPLTQDEKQLIGTVLLGVFDSVAYTFDLVFFALLTLT